MSNSYSINQNPRTWMVIQIDYHPLYNNGPFVLAEYGSWSNYKESGTHPMIMYIRKSIYDNLIISKYTIDINEKMKLVIKDESGNIIEPIRKNFCY